MQNFVRFVGAPLMAILLAVQPAVASAAGGASTQTQPQAMATEDGKFVQDLGNEAIAVIADKDLSRAQRGARFRHMLETHFDLPTIAHYVIGRSSWDAATDQQRQQYLMLFEELVVKTYGERFTLYKGEQFRVTTVRQESEQDTLIGSEITHSDGGRAATVDWRLDHKRGAPGIIDVIVEGVSLCVTQKQEYAAVIQADGGKLDPLLARMREEIKNAERSNGG